MDSAIDPTANVVGRENETGAAQRPTANSAANGDEQALPSLEDEVKQLAGSISSWWSSFSKQSQQQINDVRAHVDAQGGIVSMAKREAARFEAQLNEAQQSARHSVQASAPTAESDDQRRKRMSVDLDGWGTVGSVGGPEEGAEAARQSKGKGKAKELNDGVDDGVGDDGAAVDRLERRSRERSKQQERGSEDSAQGRLSSTETGDALFDADAPDDGPGSEFKVIEDAAQTAMHSMQSFWERIQTDERVNKLQASVAKTLQNIAVPPKRAEGDEASETEKDHSAKDASVTAGLPDLSKQFQSAFPSLDWKESQAMAKRYFDASQSAARDWGKEMGTLMSDLVHIVPPPGEEHGKTEDVSALKPGSLQSSPVKPRASTTSAAAPANQAMFDADEEDFDWDNEVSTGGGGGGGGGLETTTGPQTSSWDDADPHAGQVQTVSEAEEASRTSWKQGEEEDDDSDWE